MSVALGLLLAVLATLVAVWVVYPLVMHALARGRSMPRATLPTPPSVSVVIATREAPAVVVARVANVFATHRGAEALDVVVTVDGDPGATETVARALADFGDRVTVVQGDRPGGKACALNAGVRAATGDVLVFTDSYTTFEADADPVSALAEFAMAPGVGAVSGNLSLLPTASSSGLIQRYWRYEVALRRSEAAVHSSPGVIGPVWAMPRRLWEPLPAGLILDDVYTPLRLVMAGHRVTFCEEARAIDVRPPAPGNEYRRKVRTLTGNVQLFCWLPATLVPWRNPICAQVVFHKVLRLLTPYLLVLAAVCVAVLALPLVLRLPLALTLGALAAAALVLALSPGIRRRLMGLVVWGVSMQAAALMAGVNGVRRDWDVWRR